MDQDEIIWKEINTDIDLYKFYLELLIKSATLLFAITGGIIAYYLANNDKLLIKYSLILPAIIDIGFFIVCARSVKQVKSMIEDFNSTCKKAGFATPYEMSPLSNLLILFSISYLIISLGLVGLIILC